MFFSKSEEIKNMVGDHGDVVSKCFDQCFEGLKEIFKGCSDMQMKVLTKEIRQFESEADEVRHRIIRSLLEGGLLVDSRKSLMHVIEGVDVVADICEEVLQEIYNQNMILPEFCHEDILKMMEITKEQLGLLIKSIKHIVSKYKIDKMTKMIQEIEKLESDVDDVEQKLVKKVFDSDLELSEKMQYKQLINLIGSISDTIEDISDSVEIIMMARRV